MYKFIYYFILLIGLSINTLQAQIRVIIPPSEDYVKHLKAAKNHNLGLVKSKAHLNKLVNQGKLVKVKERGYGYRVSGLTHSHSYLVPRANQTLRDIAREFVKNTGQNFFVVTSLTRTLNDQDRLRGVNSNASSNDSAHSYGASFDISYVRFNHNLANNAKLERELDAVLKSFQNSGKIYYVKERLSRCFHVVVR